MGNMEGADGSSVEIPRKLLQGEHVEVRQKEIGLRGSWHPATVVKVKHSRRVVEYDELLTPDCSRRLRESIHLSNDLKHHSPTLRLKNGILTKPDRRGFIRPRPPSCQMPSPLNWKRGLLVDAFYDSAWWEGILLDDVHFNHAESKVKVFFPEEGDELRVLLNDLRVSQEWDEDSGRWAVCGYWPFHCENGRMELGSLKQMCMAHRSFSKKLWRQNRFNGLHASWAEEQGNSRLSSAPVLHKQLILPEGDSENAAQERMTLLREDSSLAMKVTIINRQDSHESVVRIHQSSRYPVTSKAGAFLDEEKLEGKGETGRLISQQTEVDPLRVTRAGVENKYENLASTVNSRVEQQLPLGSGYNLESCQEEAVVLVDHFHTPHTGLNLLAGKESLSQFVGKVKHRKSVHQNMKERLTGESRSSSRVTRSTSARVKQQSGEFPLSGSREMPNGESNSLLEEEMLLSISSAKEGPELDFQSITLNSRKNVSSNAQQAELESSDPALFDCRPCLNLQDNHSTSLQNMVLRANGAVSADCSIPHTERIRQARLAAKQYLLNAGWKLDVRNRARGLAIKQETVYISPSGSRFFSLAAACRGWKSCGKNGNSLGEGISKEIELLNAYRMAEDFKCLQKPNTRQAKTEQVNLSGGLPEAEGNTSLFMTDSKVPGRPRSSVDVIEERSMKPSSSTSILANNCAQRDTRMKKNNSSQIQKKRKSEVLDVSSPPEVRRKRGRPPLQKGGNSPLKESKSSRVRGGCRMQVLLSFPENEKDLYLSKDMGEAAQFKRSTVLSWLMDKGILKDNEPVSYINRKDGHVMKKGHVTREGIVCDCCKDVFALSNFEAHAGSKLHRPSANTFLDDGRSISDCQLEACALLDAKEKEGFMDISDDTCGVCGDGGELVLCDHCPSTFHAECIGLEVIPEGDWYCPRCSCSICGNNPLAGLDGDSTMRRCVQCELEYHLVCAQGQGHAIPTLAETETMTWFCSRQCREIFTALRGLVGISNPMESGFSWILLRSMKKDQGLSPSSLEDMAEHHSKLSVAHGVMQECFVPMIDPRTNINLLSQALYNRRSKVTRLNYTGFYTMLLERGDEIISVATVRVHGARLAEMPLVGTRYQYRRQGMCRRLMHALEEMLKSIGVRKLVLPAVPELLETWMGAFNFQKISPQETRELSKLSLMTFPGTTLLQKHLSVGTGAVKSVCLPHVSDKADQTESPTCKSVEYFFTMARASLDSGTLDCGEAFLSGSMNGSGQSFCAVSNMFSHLPQSVRPSLPVDPRTPVTMEASKGYSNMFSNGGKFKNRFRNKDQLESPGDPSVISKVQQDDDIYTKVVIATTRSNRLVKSKRWVADGLKELKNAKQSKRTSATPATCSEPAVELDCGHRFETLAHSNIGQEVGHDVKNFYVRTRRKTPPMSVEGTEVNEAQIGEAREWRHNSVVHSSQSNYEVHYDITMGMVDSKSSSSRNENMTDFTSDEGLNSGTCCGDGLHLDQSGFMDDVMDELSTCPKFYSRRKKRESTHTNFTDIISKGTAAQMTESMVHKGTFCAPDEGSLPGFDTSFTVPIRPCLAPGGVDGQGFKLHGLDHSLC